VRNSASLVLHISSIVTLVYVLVYNAMRDLYRDKEDSKLPSDSALVTT
jgi:hypothetical protein